MPNITTNHAITYTNFSPTVYCLKALEQAIRVTITGNNKRQIQIEQFLKYSRWKQLKTILWNKTGVTLLIFV